MQQLSSNYFASRTEHDHIAYQIKGHHKCSNMVANILPVDSPLTLGMGSKAFSEQSHVAYQITGKHKCSSNMVAPPPDPGGQNVKIQLFQNMVIFISD